MDTPGKSPTCLSANLTASSSVSAKMAPVSCGTSTGELAGNKKSLLYAFCTECDEQSSFRLCYVQSLTGHKSPVTAVSASETTGDIATVCDSGEKRWPCNLTVCCTCLVYQGCILYLHYSCFSVTSGRRKRPSSVDGERRPGRSCPLQGDHLLRGLFQPAGGRVCQRHSRRTRERCCQVTFFSLPLF